MARAPHAEHVTQSAPFAAVIDIPRELRIHEDDLPPNVNVSKIFDDFVQMLRTYLANNITVLVKRGHPERRHGFSIENIRMMRLTVDYNVTWHGMDVLSIHHSHIDR
jgi:hypothetical protein